MRAGDADRQAVADQLRAALDEGRLDLHEYDERLQGTYAAKTYGELSSLLADLPSVIAPQQSQVLPVAGATPVQPAAGVTRRWLADTWDDYLAAVGITTVIWLVICVMSQELLYFWPGWVAGPWGAFLVYETIRGLAGGEPRKWAAKQERRQAERQAKKLAKRERRAVRDDEPR